MPPWPFWRSPRSEQRSGPPRTRRSIGCEAGTRRFVADLPAIRTSHAPRALIRAQAHPFAAVLTCADSLTPAEVIFDAHPGELFVLRVAGAVADRAVLASVEYAVDQLRTPLILVMGHDVCSAVGAAAAPPKESRGPNLDYVLSAIRPAVARAQTRPTVIC